MTPNAQPTRVESFDRSALAQSVEPPYTDPYVRWCGRGGAARLPPIPISLKVVLKRSRRPGLALYGTPRLLWNTGSPGQAGRRQYAANAPRPNYWLLARRPAAAATAAPPGTARPAWCAAPPAGSLRPRRPAPRNSVRREPATASAPRVFSRPARLPSGSWRGG